MTAHLMPIISDPLMMLAVGCVCSFCAAAAQASREAGRVIGPVAFVAARPYRVVLGVLASVAAFVLLSAAGEGTPGAAFGLGYAGADVLQRAADAAHARMDKTI